MTEKAPAVPAVTSRGMIERELRAIWDARGTLTPAAVVEEARTQNHPLHGHFEWDDQVAGAAYRCTQAAQMIRQVRITIEAGDPDEMTHRVRAWLPASYAGDKTAEPSSYVPADTVQSPAQRELVLRQMRREAAALRRRYSHLQEYWDLLDDLRDEEPAALEPGS